MLKYCWNIVQILFKYCSNIVEILLKYCSNIVQNINQFRAMFWTILITIYNLKLLNIVHFISQYCSELFAELFVKLFFVFCLYCTQYKWKIVWYMHQIVQNCLQYCCYPMIAGTTQGLASVRGLPNPGPRRTWKKSELSGAPRNSDSKTCRLESLAKTPVRNCARYLSILLNILFNVRY